MSGKWLVELGDAINCKECRYGANCNVGRGHGYKVGKCTQFEREKKQTNADRIRAMSDEELAKWLETKVWDLPWCNDDTPVDDETKICSKWDCVKCALEWLKQEVSDDS